MSVHGSRGQPQSRRRLQPGALGQDFGSSTSKLALCYLKHDVWTGEDDTEHSDLKPHLVRISLRADLDDPERSNRADRNQYEFPAWSAIHNQTGELITGRTALAEDQSIPLKTIFLWRAGIHETEVLKRLPGGNDLQRLVRNGTLDNNNMDRAVKSHFQLLSRVAQDQALISNIAIKTIVLSFPHYLCEKENEIDPDKKYYNLDKYLNYYQVLMSEIWTDYPDIKFEFVGEGQAAALYLCEPSTDGDSLDRQKVWQTFEDLRFHTQNSMSWLPLAVIDGGSSSQGIQTQVVYFNDAGEIDSSQSLSYQEWIPGTTGGSHLTNEKMNEIIEGDLETQEVRPGDRAELRSQYETLKTDIDFLSMQGTIILHTQDDRCRSYLHPQVAKEMFAFAFGQGLDLISTEIQGLIDRLHNFGVVFCGGSYINKGLRRIVKQRMAAFEKIAAGKGVKMRHLFLARADQFPTSAVACGAALSAMRVPAVSQILRGSAIGVQALNRVDVLEVAEGHEHVTQWDEEWKADFLLSMGCREPPYIDYYLPRCLRTSLRFQLVCDPNYYLATKAGPRRITATRRLHKSHRRIIKDLPSATGTTTTFRRLPINPTPSRQVNGPQETYDLNFSINAADLPPHRIRFRALGSNAECLAAYDGANKGGDEGTESTIELRCTKLDKASREVDHPRNKRWLLTLRSDLASKLLTATYKLIPIWCAGCGEKITDEVYICGSCTTQDVTQGFCPECYEEDNVGHHADHEYDRIRMY